MGSGAMALLWIDVSHYMQKNGVNYLYARMSSLKTVGIAMKLGGG